MLQWIEKKLSQRRSPSPTSPIRCNSKAAMTFSFDESDDEMRRIRTNSRGRTQNIFRRTRKTEQGDADSRKSSSGSSSPVGSPSSPQPLVVLDDCNRYI